MNVEVYWNLHKDCFSIRCCKTGKVVDHCSQLMLSDVKYVVREGGRQKVIETGHKNVHAFVKGNWLKDQDILVLTGESNAAIPVTYNPYKHSSFVAIRNEEPIQTSNLCVMYTQDNKPRVLALW